MTHERQTARAAQRDRRPATDHDHVELTDAELVQVVGGRVIISPPPFPD